MTKPKLNIPEGIEVTYHKGYLIPTTPNYGRFNAREERALIAKGTHFFCDGHLGAIPIGEQSPDDARYCVECLKSNRGG